VRLQTLAIYTETAPGSQAKASAQLARFPQLLKEAACTGIQFRLAFENASGIAEEGAPLVPALEALDRIDKPVYISLTWEGENRFGGGNQTRVGLKEEGKRLLAWMNERGIPVDFSHTSDDLAYDILNWIEQEHLTLPVLASHSNFRRICPALRNLPDDLARELIKRKGVIGLNCFGPFIDPVDPYALVRHVEWGLELGGAEALCMGADFFCIEGSEEILRKKYGQQGLFYEALGNASTYPALLAKFPAPYREAIAHGNGERFIHLTHTKLIT
jgi:microsomal dipeptidase-like Zn-dependent dipeptidase